MFAVLDESDAHHESCAAAFDFEMNPLLPEAVLPELAYLLLRRGDYKKLNTFLRSIVVGDFSLVRTELSDLERAAAILEKYADSCVDFVDCVIVAIAERLNIKRILTVDRRHFNLFRPLHCAHFEILP
jgi:predicted nucleic acid-binding protein